MYIQNVIIREPDTCLNRGNYIWHNYTVSISRLQCDFPLISSDTQMLETAERKVKCDYNYLQSKTFLSGEGMRAL